MDGREEGRGTVRACGPPNEFYVKGWRGSSARGG